MNLNNGFEDAAVTAMIGLVEWPKASADANATAATAETAIGLIGPGPVNIAIGSASFHSGAGLTAGGTVGAIMTLWKRTPGTASATAAAGITLGQLNTGGQSLASFVGNGFSMAAGAFVGPNDAITITITKTGAGQVVPQGILVMYTSIN